MSLPVEPTEANIAIAATLLHQDQLVVFPTETVYGLGANACSASAVARIFSAKGRPSDNPLIVHVHCLDAARPFLHSVDPLSELLAATFWPGPLTIVLPLAVNSPIATNVSVGLDTVGVRVPDHPVALALLKAAELPLAAPSSNRSGSPSPTTALHVFNDLVQNSNGVVGPAMILDGGSCRVGLESTVVQVKEGVVHILRPGAITSDQIACTARRLGDAAVLNLYTGRQTEAPRAPGMKYRHYAPSATVIAVLDWTNVAPADADLVIAFDTNQLRGFIGRRVSFGTSSEDVETASNRLFDLFRMADEVEAPRVLVDCTFDRESGLGAALWNRISKAASRV